MASLGVASIDIVADAAGLAASLSRGVDDAVRDIERDLSRGIERIDVDDAGKSLGDDFAEGFLDEVTRELRVLDEEIEKAFGDVDVDLGLDDEFDDLAREAERAGEKIEDSLEEAAKVSAREFDEAADKMVDDLERVGREAGETERKSRGMGDALKIAAGAFAATQIVQGLRSVIDEAAAVDTGLREVTTLLSEEQLAGLGGFDALSDQVNEFSTEFGTLPQDVIPSLYQAISAGVPTDNVFEFLEVAQQAAVGGVTDLETAVDGISSVVNAYGSDVIGAGEASDLMFTAVRLGKTTFDELSQSLFQVAPIAAGLGVEFSDVTAGLAALTAQGVPTRVASTNLRQAIAELGKEGSAASDTFAELSGQSFTDFIDGGGNLEEAFSLMADGAAEMDTTVNNLFGSVEAGTAVLALTSSDAFANAIDEMGESANATADAFAKIDESPARALERISAQFAVLQGELGRALLPAIDALLPTITTLVDTLGPAIGGVFETIAEVAGPILEGLSGLVGPVIEAFAVAFSGIIGALTPVLDALAPILAVIGDALGESLMAIIEALADPLASLGETFGVLLTAVTPFIELLGDAFAEIISALAPVLATMGNNLAFVAEAVVGALLPALEALLPAFTVILDAIIPIIDQLAGALIERFVAFLPTVVALIEPLTLVLVVLAEVFGRVLEAVAPLLDVIVGVFLEVFSAQTDIIEELADVGVELAEVLVVLVEAVEPLLDLLVLLLEEGIELLLPAVEFLSEALSDDLGQAVGVVSQVLGRITSAMRPVVEVISGFIGWVVDAASSVDGFRSALDDLRKVPGRVLEALGTFVDNAVAFFASLPARAVAAIQQFGPMVADFIFAAMEFVGTKIVEGVLAWISFVAGLPQRIVDVIVQLPGLVGGVFTSVKTTVDNIIRSLVDAAVDFFVKLPGRIIALAGAMQDAGRDFMAGLIRGIAGAASGALNIAESIFERFRGLLNSVVIDPLRNFTLTIDLPGSRFDINAQPFSRIPRFAEGDLVDSPTLGIFGEAGAELLLPLTKAMRSQALLATHVPQSLLLGAVAQQSGNPMLGAPSAAGTVLVAPVNVTIPSTPTVTNNTEVHAPVTLSMPTGNPHIAAATVADRIAGRVGG